MSRLEKMIFHSFDAIFHLVEIDPRLPDPEKCTQPLWRLPVMPDLSAPRLLETKSEIPQGDLIKYETFERLCLNNPRNGRRIYYWSRCNG